MTYDEIKEFMHKKVIVTDIDENHIKGTLTNTVSEYDTTSGKEEIELDAGKISDGSPLDEIKNIVEIQLAVRKKTGSFYF